MYSNNGHAAVLSAELLDGHSLNGAHSDEHEIDECDSFEQSSPSLPGGVDIRAILAAVGLSEPEVSVYLSSLEVGSRPASVIAKRAGLKRGQTYNVLATLMQKGIVQEFIKNNTRFFTSSSPSSLISILENRQSQIEKQKSSLLSALPLLEQIRNPHVNQPKVRFFHGMDGIREIFEDILRVSEDCIYSIVDPQMLYFDHSSELAASTGNFVRKRVERNKQFRAISPRSELGQKVFAKNDAELRSVWSLDFAANLEVAFYCYDSKLAIISNQTCPFGLIVDDAMVARTFKVIHSAVCALLPQYDATESKL